MPLIWFWRRGVKKHFKGLSDHLKRYQFTTLIVLCPNRSCHHCKCQFFSPLWTNSIIKGNFFSILCKLSRKGSGNIFLSCKRLPKKSKWDCLAKEFITHQHDISEYRMSKRMLQKSFVVNYLESPNFLRMSTLV